MTLVVNLFAGPGTGKSTNTALIFGKLKIAGVNAEIVHEFAKDLVWEERHTALGYQPYIAGKQLYHVHRLLGKVDVIVTDSPILFCSHIYNKADGPADACFREFVLQTFKSWNTFNVFLRRNIDIHPFLEAGRNQTLAEAIELDRQIANLLTTKNIDHTVYAVQEGFATADVIVADILHSLGKD